MSLILHFICVLLLIYTIILHYKYIIEVNKRHHLSFCVGINYKVILEWSSFFQFPYYFISSHCQKKKKHGPTHIIVGLSDRTMAGTGCTRPIDSTHLLGLSCLIYPQRDPIFVAQSSCMCNGIFF